MSQEQQDDIVAIEDIDPNDDEMIDNQVRDSLIKAFMVIFTNE